jgi:hypothetical protein
LFANLPTFSFLQAGAMHIQDRVVDFWQSVMVDNVPLKGYGGIDQRFNYTDGGLAYS